MVSRRARDRVFTVKILAAAALEERLEEVLALLEHYLPKFGKIKRKVEEEEKYHSLFIPKKLGFSSKLLSFRHMTATEEALEKARFFPEPGKHPVTFHRGTKFRGKVRKKEGFSIGVVENEEFYLSPEDFFRHAYVVGQTGTAKKNPRVVVELLYEQEYGREEAAAVQSGRAEEAEAERFDDTVPAPMDRRSILEKYNIKEPSEEEIDHIIRNALGVTEEEDTLPAPPTTTEPPKPETGQITPSAATEKTGQKEDTLPAPPTTGTTSEPPAKEPSSEAGMNKRSLPASGDILIPPPWKKAPKITPKEKKPSKATPKTEKPEPPEPRTAPEITPAKPEPKPASKPASTPVSKPESVPKPQTTQQPPTEEDTAGKRKKKKKKLLHEILNDIPNPRTLTFRGRTLTCTERIYGKLKTALDFAETYGGTVYLTKKDYNGEMTYSLEEAPPGTYSLVVETEEGKRRFVVNVK